MYRIQILDIVVYLDPVLYLVLYVLDRVQIGTIRRPFNSLDLQFGEYVLCIISLVCRCVVVLKMHINIWTGASLDQREDMTAILLGVDPTVGLFPEKTRSLSATGECSPEHPSVWFFPY